MVVAYLSIVRVPERPSVYDFMSLGRREIPTTHRPKMPRDILGSSSTVDDRMASFRLQ